MQCKSFEISLWLQRRFVNLQAVEYLSALGHAICRIVGESGSGRSRHSSLIKTAVYQAIRPWELENSRRVVQSALELHDSPEYLVSAKKFLASSLACFALH